MSEDFVRGSDRLAKALADPERRARVDVIRAQMRQADRAHKMGLAAVRQAANLTQVELANRMGIGQAALSGLENREDLLLSTLASYLEAVGARDVMITARLGDNVVELALSSADAAPVAIEPPAPPVQAP
ncbi:helix-turn-helix domain-containing protein [Mycolicibacterium palauense]|uniref:helix-turn-helix domain-containing protein n=1 Tax=Mycolicibacterium palauense TaxID=2034511 RepID=UPI000BFF06F4|nr:helix-turn-helix domain-containing protein [Mycolicibacterium palauense]